MIYAYMKQLPDQNSLSRQQQAILTYALTLGLDIEKEVMEYSSPSHTIEEREKFEAFIHSLKEGDVIVTKSLQILSSHIHEIVKIINCMLSHHVDLHIVDTGTLINRQTPIEKVFPLLNSLNEEQKQKRTRIGRPKGSRSSSKFDTYQQRIITLLKNGMSVSAIARELGVSRSSLKDYIESRELRRLIEKSWVEISQERARRESEHNSTLLICPFENKQTKEIRS